jgi:GntR family transcriptional repressor for pyruvate dehydrogenase complex
MAQQASTGRPKYLLIADSLREKIKTGTYPVDSKLPAVHELATAHGTAPNTVRSAISVLAREGVVESFQGDGIYVRKLPGPEAPAALADEVGSLRDEVRHLTERVESLEPGDVKAALERVELNLIDLYGKLGFDYPHEGEDGHVVSGTVAHGNRA